MHETDFRWRRVALAGLVSGLVQVTAGVIMYVSGVYFAPWSALVNLVLLVSAIAVGTRWCLNRGPGGRRPYWTALRIGLGIAVSTALVYVTYNVISIRFVYPHFLEDMARATAARQSAGLNEADAQQILQSLSSRTSVAMVARNNFTSFCLFGTITSLVSAFFFRKRTSR